MWRFCSVFPIRNWRWFGGVRYVRQDDVYLIVAYHDPIGNRFYYAALLVPCELGPPRLQLPRARDRVTRRQELNLQEIDVGLKLWNLVIQLFQAFLKARIPLGEASA